MKTYKTEVVPAHERKVLDEFKCDICKKDGNRGESWGNGAYDVEEVTVEWRTGERYPGCVNVEVTSYDICPGCFANVLEPFLKSKGAEPSVREIDY